MSKRSQSSVPDTEAGDNGDQETFMRRWARRKASTGRESSATDDAKAGASDESGRKSSDGSVDAAARRQASETGQLTPESAVQTEVAQTDPEKGDEDMPSLDTIDDGGSVADFFSSRVSPGLRKAALRRLFGQSTLQVVDDLDDYADDYTKLVKLGDLVTNEMRYRMEVVRKRLLEQKPEVAADESDVYDASVSTAAAAPDPVPQTPDGQAGQAEGAEEDQSGRAKRPVHHADQSSSDESSRNQGSTKESSENDPDPG
ncbi:MAG TPA: DUF3306 domain-containing protein [Wenzhouxiangellaceae bacterium]|nr:DUF3306 domain-containing protein [Wenzhouxiangellaceae bacterium]